MKNMFNSFMAFAFIFILAGCSIEGVVKDNEGQAIVNAKVIATYNDTKQEVYTDNVGHYLIRDTNLVEDVEVELVVSKQNYISQTQTQVLTGSNTYTDFTLEKVTTPVDSNSRVNFGKTVNLNISESQLASSSVELIATASTLSDAKAKDFISYVPAIALGKGNTITFRINNGGSIKGVTANVLALSNLNSTEAEGSSLVVAMLTDFVKNADGNYQELTFKIEETVESGHTLVLGNVLTTISEINYVSRDASLKLVVPSGLNAGESVNIEVINSKDQSGSEFITANAPLSTTGVTITGSFQSEVNLGNSLNIELEEAQLVNTSVELSATTSSLSDANAKDFISYVPAITLGKGNTITFHISNGGSIKAVNESTLALSDIASTESNSSSSLVVAKLIDFVSNANGNYQEITFRMEETVESGHTLVLGNVITSVFGINYVSRDTSLKLIVPAGLSVGESVNLKVINSKDQSGSEFDIANAPLSKSGVTIIASSKSKVNFGKNLTIEIEESELENNSVEVSATVSNLHDDSAKDFISYVPGVALEKGSLITFQVSNGATIKKVLLHALALTDMEASDDNQSTTGSAIVATFKDFVPLNGNYKELTFKLVKKVEAGHTLLLGNLLYLNLETSYVSRNEALKLVVPADLEAGQKVEIKVINSVSKSGDPLRLADAPTSETSLNVVPTVIDTTTKSKVNFGDSLNIEVSESLLTETSVELSATVSSLRDTKAKDFISYVPAIALGKGNTITFRLTNGATIKGISENTLALSNIEANSLRGSASVVAAKLVDFVSSVDGNYKEITFRIERTVQVGETLVLGNVLTNFVGIPYISRDENLKLVVPAGLTAGESVQLEVVNSKDQSGAELIIADAPLSKSNITIVQ